MSRHHGIATIAISVSIAIALAVANLVTAAPLVAEEPNAQGASGASGASDSTPREVVRLGIFDLGPYMMTDSDGQAGGASVDFWRERIAPLMGIDVEVSGPYPIPRLEKMLEDGEVDAIPYITKIAAREARFLYPSLPIAKISPCIIVRRDSAIASIESQEDLFDLKIGFITSAYIPPFVQHERIKLELITATDFRQINHQKLINGRVDALLDINHVSYLYEMLRRGYAQDIRVIPLRQGQTSIYSLFTASPRGQDLRARYESALSAIPAGIFDGIVDRYIKGER